MIPEKYHNKILFDTEEIAIQINEKRTHLLEDDIKGMKDVIFLKKK